jgi:hypothetical protein
MRSLADAGGLPRLQGVAAAEAPHANGSAPEAPADAAEVQPQEANGHSNGSANPDTDAVMVE